MQSSRIEEIADVDTGSVNPDSYVDKEEVELTNVVIGAILKLKHYRPCMRCKSRVEPIGSNQGQCTTDDCLTLQRYDLCSEHTSAKLLLKPHDALPGDNSRDVHVVMSNKFLKDLTNTTDYSTINENLIMSSAGFMSIKYNKDTFQVTSFAK